MKKRYKVILKTEFVIILALIMSISFAICVVADDKENESTEHEHSYSTITTKATLSQNGKKVKKCSVCGASETILTIYRPKSIYLSKTEYVYDGNVKKPSVVVKDTNGKALENGTDYTVSYPSGRTECGTYTVTVTFKGNYSGNKSLEFKIKLGTVKALERQDGNYMNLSWSEVTGASGYEVYVKDDFADKFICLKTTENTGLYNSNINGTMTFKVRAYRNLPDGKIAYGSYSEVKTFSSI